jgi:hypothetical protein
MACRDNRQAFCRRRDPDFDKIEMIFRSACDWHPPLLLFASPGFSPDGLRRWRVAQARRGQDCEEAWWHRIAWLPPYDGSGNRRDRASRAGRTLRRGGLNQTERQNKTKCETQPHALLRRPRHYWQTISLTSGGAYAKSAELLRAVLAHGEIAFAQAIAAQYRHLRHNPYIDQR